MADYSSTQSGTAFRSAHFIGAGGAGMSGIALVLHERGCIVTGSDLKTSRYIRQLLRAGVSVHVGHDASLIDEAEPDVVVVSTAIPETNPELVRARELGIPVWPRAKMLAALGHGCTTIAVAGTHGKTTTASMCATMLDRMGLDPSFLIGGIVEGYKTNGRNGSGTYFVAEADESDSSFLYLEPRVVVVTNVEADHLDHYGSLAEIENTFAQFMSLVGEQGVIVACGDDKQLYELARSTSKRIVTYGFDARNDIVCEVCDDRCAQASGCRIRFPDGRLHEVDIAHNPGRHNMLNASAAMGVAFALGLDTAAAARALSTFEGVRRRFTRVGDVCGVTVVDDYGHHPTEIKATLAAARGLDYRHIDVVFQPHRYSRLKAFLDDFADAFADADKVVLIDVFSAGEMPIPGVTSKALADTVRARHPDKQVSYVSDRMALMERLETITEPGDLLITMGAGDISAVAPEYIEYLDKKKVE
ncbi:UDP-N-acetylmuramate--L-alanine ligase [Coriobacterium glomerans PW2]|uniref:UDP-N-acetylmuramate--L-alanine ligase n=1 Tax=Coriobacterium glomerans (strain ATCC 49209 / DSM 20642 / JCM 10262 / PW2) TaxID=700015 RepID=F2NBR7_CORGP|nr:UDP-N-acetylmuramate--L-alanine ligase [Coriobacterium glomerans]AEB06876.1 UDP-N-acetylmuramate--L-alanine ligase [Coriobacterium glomerans PW2]